MRRDPVPLESSDRSPLRVVSRGIGRLWHAVLHLPAALYVAVLLFAFACAGFILAFGLTNLAAAQDELALRRSRSLAPSPLFYGVRFLFPGDSASAFGSLADSTKLWLILRVDSLTPARSDEPPCEGLTALGRSLEAEGSIRVRYISLSQVVPACAARWPLERPSWGPRDGSADPRAKPPGSPSLRWGILDGSGRSLYSSSDPPAARDVSAIVSVLRAGRVPSRVEAERR